jgi:dUTP pyrophosphatase
MKIKVKKLDKRARLPTYATDGSGCFDLFSINDVSIHGFEDTWGIANTGLAFEIPPGYVMLVYSRSGHAFTNDVRLANCVGVIDSDYRGEVKVKLTLDDPQNPFKAQAGRRVAQAMIVPIPKVEFILTDELSETLRGTGGLGSTGA